MACAAITRPGIGAATSAPAVCSTSRWRGVVSSSQTSPRTLDELGVGAPVLVTEARDERADKTDIRSDTKHLCLIERPCEQIQRGAPVRTEGDDLPKERVVVPRHQIALFVTRIDPDAGPYGP